MLQLPHSEELVNLLETFKRACKDPFPIIRHLFVSSIYNAHLECLDSLGWRREPSFALLALDARSSVNGGAGNCN